MPDIRERTSRWLWKEQIARWLWKRYGKIYHDGHYVQIPWVEIGHILKDEYLKDAQSIFNLLEKAGWKSPDQTWSYQAGMLKVVEFISPYLGAEWTPDIWEKWHTFLKQNGLIEVKDEH